MLYVWLFFLELSKFSRSLFAGAGALSKRRDVRSEKGRAQPPSPAHWPRCCFNAPGTSFCALARGLERPPHPALAGATRAPRVPKGYYYYYSIYILSTKRPL